MGHIAFRNAHDTRQGRARSAPGATRSDEIEICAGQNGSGQTVQNDRPAVMHDLKIASDIADRQRAESTGMTRDPQDIQPVLEILDVVGYQQLKSDLNIRKN